MVKAGQKTVRFTRVVERSGEPRVHTLWLPPAKDSELKRAVKTDRVMTIEPGGIHGKRDVGVVGFELNDRDARQYLIFPKSLKRFDGARVVGIKFNLIEQPASKVVRGAGSGRPARRKPRRNTKRLRSA